MCGIAGFIAAGGRGGPSLERDVRRMCETLVHRGPDGDGVWADSEAGVAIGHRRLSIIDLSDAGAQPMVSASDRLVISYNGEIYNAPELRRDLEARGTRFRGHSDTEVVLEACAAWGVHGAAGRLIGMFAFAVWNRDERSLHLVRDRLGIKPLCYAASHQGFLFASDLNALRAHPAFTGTPDPEAVEAYLACDYVPGPNAVYHEARKLAPGTLLRVDAAAPHAPREETYWSLRDAARARHGHRHPGTIEEAADELEELLRDAVRRRLVSDVPLGAFLSGGIDSSSVVALMREVATGPVRTYSIGFSGGAFDEAPHARAIARHLGTEHREHYVAPEEIGRGGPAILAHADEPLADPSLLPTTLLSRLARTEVTVALSGDGGDELFGGYPRHHEVGRILAHPAFGFRPPGRAALIALMLALPRPARPLPAGLLQMFRTAPLSGRELGLLARVLRNPAAIFHHLHHADIAAIGRGIRGPRAVVEGIRRRLREVDFLSPTERQQYLDAVEYLPDDILTKVDRASMSTSLEVRVPILDHRVVEFSLGLPPAMKAEAPRPKAVLRALLARHVPRKLFERPKEGFAGPVGLWINGCLREWASDTVADFARRRTGLAPRRLVRRALWRLRRRRARQKDYRIIALAAWHGARHASFG